MKKFSIKFKNIALILAVAFAFQSMTEINSHTYSSKGTIIHFENSCLFQIPTHISYFCDEYH